MPRWLPSGSAQGRVRGPDGRWRHKTFKAADGQPWRKAESWEREQRTQLDRGTWIDPRRSKVRIDEVSGRWLAHLDNEVTLSRLSPATVAQRRSLLANHVLPKWGRWPIQSLTRNQISAWVGDLLSTPSRATQGHLRASTVRQCLVVLSGLLSWAVGEGLIAQNPSRGISVGGGSDQDPGRRRYLTPEEYHRLVLAVEPRYQALISVCALGGLRVGEAAALTPSRIDGRRIRIDRAVREISGKLSIGPPKGGRSRSIVVPVQLAEILSEHIDHYQLGPAELLFPSRSGSLLSRTWFSQRVLVPALRRAQLGKVTLHDLRHTNVSWAIEAGQHPKKIQQRLGHSTYQITMDVYGHLMDHEDEGPDELDAFLVARSRHMRLIQGGEETG